MAKKQTTPKLSGNHALPAGKKGTLFVISAPSGAGKTTLCREVRERLPDLKYSISHTTRPPRKEELHGRDYFFVSVEEFNRMVESDQWAEWAEVHGNFYGTSSLFLDRHLADGDDILLDIDVQGAQQIVNRYPESVTIFIMPPSAEALTQRLTGRGTDSAEVIEKRLRNAREEMAKRVLYHHVVINDHLAEAIQELVDIIQRRRGLGTR